MTDVAMPFDIKFEYQESLGLQDPAVNIISNSQWSPGGMIANGSFEVDTTGWTAAGSVISRLVLDGKYGGVSLNVACNGAGTSEGVQKTALSFTSGLQYTGRVWVKGSGTFRLMFFDDTAAATVGTPTTVGALTSEWQEVTVTVTAVNTGTHKLLAYHNAVEANTFQLDGATVLQDTSVEPFDTHEFTITTSLESNGVCAMIAAEGAQTDEFSIIGVTHDGEALTKIVGQGTGTTEVGAVSMWFNGEVTTKTGTRTVSITTEGADGNFKATFVTITGGANMVADDFASDGADALNPEVSVSSETRTSVKLAVVVSGHDALASITFDTNKFTSITNVDFGTMVAHFIYETTPSIGSTDMKFVAIAEDYAIAAIAISLDPTLTHQTITKGFMLAAPPGETKVISSDETQKPDVQRISSMPIATSQDFDPLYDTPISQISFHGGAGQKYLDFQDEYAYWWSTGVVTHDGRAYLAPYHDGGTTFSSTTGYPVTKMLAWYDSSTETRYMFLAVKNQLWRKNVTSDTAWELLCSTSFNIADISMTGSILWVTTPDQTNTNAYYYKSAPAGAAPWTLSISSHTLFDAAGNKPSFFESVRGTLFGCVNKNKVYYNTDLLITGWAGPIDIGVGGNTSGRAGDGTYNFKGAIAVSDTLYTWNNQAIYSIDSSQEVTEVIWQWKNMPDINNFRFVTSGAKKLIFSVGPEVYTFDPISGEMDSINLTMREGFRITRISGVAADNRFVYVAANVRVTGLYGEDKRVIFRCYKVSTDRGWKVEVIYQQDVLENRWFYGLWAFSDEDEGTILCMGEYMSAAATRLFMFRLPSGWDETIDSSDSLLGYLSSQTASLYTSVSKTGFPGFTKKHLYFNAIGQNIQGPPLATTSNISVYYSMDEGVSFTYLGDFDDELDAITSSFDDANSKSIMFRFDFTTDSDYLTPILQTYDHHQRVRFKYLPRLSMAVKLGSNLTLRNRALYNRRIDQLWTDLTTLRTLDNEITYKDFLGNNFPVTIDSIQLRPSRHYTEQSTGNSEYDLEAVISLARADRGE